MVITPQEKDELTQRVSEVKVMLDDLVDAPHDRDTLKAACQICKLFLADTEIPPRWCDGSYLHRLNILGVDKGGETKVRLLESILFARKTIGVT